MCGDSFKNFLIAVIFLILALILYTYGFYSPHFIEVEIEEDNVKLNIGLWKSCQRKGGQFTCGDNYLHELGTEHTVFYFYLEHIKYQIIVHIKRL